MPCRASYVLQPECETATVYIVLGKLFTIASLVYMHVHIQCVQKANRKIYKLRCFTGLFWAKTTAVMFLCSFLSIVLGK